VLAGRIIDPVSKLAAARTLSPATASTSLGEVLGLDDVDDAELYAALDWLLERQAAIETALARRHLHMWTAPSLQDAGQCFDPIACVHMSGLLMRSPMSAGQDGFRDESSKQ
jgi:hypothetical protein